MLLAEIHHRVKNNMAIISGLLELQVMMGEDPQKALPESLSRIKSMALVHEVVYKSDSFSEIDLDEFIHKIAGHLRSSIPKLDKVNVDCVSALQNLNLNQAVPLGLLINEVAFYLCTLPGLKDLERIEISLSIASEADQVCLSISLPFKGIDNTLQQSDESSFKMVLIENLLGQLDAVLEPEASEHTSFEIRFKPDSKKGASSSYL